MGDKGGERGGGRSVKVGDAPGVKSKKGGAAIAYDSAPARLWNQE